MKLPYTLLALLSVLPFAARAHAQTCPANGTLQREIVYDDASAPFNGIRDVVVHNDGRVLVAESDGTALKLFDAAGKFVRTIGRDGEGPGEFRSIANLRILGDSIWVFDDRLRRGTFLNMDGTVRGTINFATPLPNGQSYGNVLPMGSGYFVLPALPPLSAMPEEVYRELYVLDARAQRVTTIAPPLRMRGFITTLRLPEGGTISLQHPTPTIDRIGIGRRNAHVVIARGDVEANGNRYLRITRIASNGDTVFHRRLGIGPVPVESAFLDSAMTRALRIYQPLYPSEAAARRAISSAWEVEKHYPPVSGFSLDGSERIWIRTTPARNRWLLLSDAGVPIACVDVANDVRLAAARDNTVWVVRTGADDVQSLERHRLTIR